MLKNLCIQNKNMAKILIWKQTILIANVIAKGSMKPSIPKKPLRGKWEKDVNKKFALVVVLSTVLSSDLQKSPRHSMLTVYKVMVGKQCLSMKQDNGTKVVIIAFFTAMHSE